MVSHLQVSGDFVWILLVIYVISAAEIVPAKLKRGVKSLPQFKKQNVDVEVIMFINFLSYENLIIFILFIFDFQHFMFALRIQRDRDVQSVPPVDGRSEFDRLQ